MNLAWPRTRYAFSELRYGVRLWIILGAPAVTLVVGAIYWSASLAFEYAHNPDRHLYEVLAMAPLLAAVSFVIASAAQFATYAVLPLGALALIGHLGRVPLAPLLLLTPFLGLLAWYGYDHLVPDFRLMTDTNPPYEHGLTIERFLKAWGLEAAIALGYWWPIKSIRTIRSV